MNNKLLLEKITLKTATNNMYLQWRGLGVKTKGLGFIF
jgi:hypothetical protein